VPTGDPGSPRTPSETETVEGSTTMPMYINHFTALPDR
jgi:hypothetical protein